MILRRLHHTWLVLTGQIDLGWLSDRAETFEKCWMEARAERNKLQSDLALAKAGIADLKSKLPANWEAQERAASDALAAAVIDDMNRNPKKYTQ